MVNKKIVFKFVYHQQKVKTMNATISMEYLLKALSGLSLSNRKWLAAHLVEPWEREEVKTSTDDELFVNQFLNTPYDNPMSAKEAKKIVRESRHFEKREHKTLYNG